jgi:hypothetical protein
MALQNYSCTVVPFCFQILKQQYSTIGNFRNWHSVDLFADIAHFILIRCGYVRGQNNRCWSSENPYAVHEVPLLDLKGGICCS